MARLTWCTGLAVALLLSLLLTAVPGTPAAAAPDDEKPAAPKGKVFKNPDTGLRMTGPVGWKMAADKPKSAEWTRMVTFFDPVTRSDAVVSRRARASSGVQSLLGRVKAEWAKTPQLVVSTMRPIARTELNPTPRVQVEATFVQKVKSKDPNAPPPAPVTWRISATYLLAPKAEVLLYVKAKATSWARVRTAVRLLRQSVKFDGAADKGPTGEGAYRNDRLGFTCKYPTGYSVVTPARSAHVVQFEGTSAEQPVLGVYRIKWDAGVDKDVARMVTYYREELAGEAETRSMQVGGRTATLITARANVGGRDQTFYVAIMKRGGEIWRIKAAAAQAEEANARAVFQTFADNFRLGAAPR